MKVLLPANDAAEKVAKHYDTRLRDGFGGLVLLMFFAFVGETFASGVFHVSVATSLMIYLCNLLVAFS